MEKRYSLGKIIKINFWKWKKDIHQGKMLFGNYSKKKVMTKEIVSVFRYQ